MYHQKRGFVSIVLVVIVLVILAIAGFVYVERNNIIPIISSPSKTSGNVTSKPTPAPTHTDNRQTWKLTDQAGQVATIIVTPFAGSAHFTEDSGSAGWFVNIPGGFPARVSLSGDIFYDKAGDRWEMSKSLTRTQYTDVPYSIEFKAPGTTKGNLPDATEASGIIEGTLKTPKVSQPISGTWHGIRQ